MRRAPRKARTEMQPCTLVLREDDQDNEASVKLVFIVRQLAQFVQSSIVAIRFVADD